MNCPKCNGKMKYGVAMQSTAVCISENRRPLQIYTFGGPGKLIQVLKCERCGLSVTK